MTKQNTSAKSIAQQEYRKANNFMSEPGCTDMPEYDNNEIADIEEGKLKLREVAKKYNRSLDGVSSKKYRMSPKYKSPYARVKEKAIAWRKFAAGDVTAILPKTKVKLVDMDEIEAFLSGSITADNLLSSK